MFVFAAAEVAGLDPAFFDQRFQAIVGFAQAHSELFGQGALADFGIGFQGSEEAEAGF